MAKPTYKVWVVNQVTLGSRVDHPSEGYYFTWDQSTLSATVTTMKELFDEVCKHAHSKFQDAEVNVETLGALGAKIQTGELVVRLTKKGDSLLIKKYGSGKVGEAHGGTVEVDPSTGVLSECWIDTQAGNNHLAKLIGRLAFHELMHNKLDATDDTKDLHETSTDGTGLAVVPISYNTALSETNRRVLAPKLGSAIKQFLGTSIP